MQCYLYSELHANMQLQCRPTMPLQVKISKLGSFHVHLVAHELLVVCMYHHVLCVSLARFLCMYIMISGNLEC